MALTFTYAGPAAGSTDWLRFTIGDTDERRSLLWDEEIAYILAASGSKEAAALPCLDAAIVMAANMVSGSYGSTREDWSNRAKQLEALRPRLVAVYGDTKGADDPTVVQMKRAKPVGSPAWPGNWPGDW